MGVAAGVAFDAAVNPNTAAALSVQAVERRSECIGEHFREFAHSDQRILSGDNPFQRARNGFGFDDLSATGGTLTDFQQVDADT